MPVTSPADDLRRLLGDVEVTDRALDLAVRAHDASHYLLRPRAVASPRDRGQVAEVMRACDRLGLPLTFRAGGTSLSGQSVGDGVLVDVRGGFTGVEVLDGGARVRVQPGTTVRAVNARLAPYRRRLGPDPASEIACTVGGVIANNSSGMQCGTEANSYATVESLVVVLPSGTVVDSSRPDADRLLAQAEPALHAGLLALRDRVRGDAEAVATLRRLFAIKNTMGYGLNALLDADDPVEVLVRLMIGSEGTLGFVASAVMRTVEVLPHVATGLLLLDDLATASRLVPDVLATGVATAELLDATSLRVAGADPASPERIRRLDVGTQAALLVEVQAASADELEALRADAERVLGALPLAAPLELTTDAAERGRLWRTRKGLFSAVAGARPAGSNALLEDVAVPVERLGELATGLVGLFEAHDYVDDDPVIFGHARDGNLHFLVNERFDRPDLLARYEQFTLELVDLVLGLGGTLKAEHGTGRIMAPFVERQYGPTLTEAMREVKRLFDPRGLLNPGVVVVDPDDPDGDRAWLRDLKPTPPEVESEVDRCVECGFCEPVCPSRSLTLTPRQRIVARREEAAARAAGDHATAEAIADDYGYEGLDTCAADGMCATACPVHIDTGALVRRLRGETGSDVVHRAWAAAAGRWGAVTGSASAGLTVADKVPGLLSRPQRLAGLGAGGPRRRDVAADDADVVWFGACVGTMFGGGAASAFGELCEAGGVRLRTPEGLAGLCCGTPWKSKGHRAGWERMREQVVAALGPATDGGRLPVVVEASSCAEGLGVLVADSGFTVVDALDLVADRVLPHLEVTRRAPRAVVHPTCSSTALGSTDALVRLAGAAADDVVVPTAWGCCAFAGDRGMLRPELTAAATAPEAAEVAALPEVPGTVFVSGNRTCEIGLTRATGRPYRHVLEVLAEVTRRS
ncbi:FAD-binding and (Fe-S)-binding domain-containing protein [Nocardioides marinquilinus]|uniref:D-lactate dehydrogenase (cytochrome) n=1 Tax=Nocardioides marinquilinus TaxID=1210400 RepID=A0ABP9Q1P4_9ACTN